MYYTRTTHDFNNKTRMWEYKGVSVEADIVQQKSLKSCIGIHALNSGRWMRFMEVVRANQEYYEQYKDDPYGGVTLESCSEENVLDDLKQMEKWGWVKSSKDYPLSAWTR
jgi:hypothetical protein